MKLCRFEHAGSIRCGLFSTDRIIPLDDLASVSGERYVADAIAGGTLMNLLPCDSPAWITLTRMLGDPALTGSFAAFALPRSEVRLLPPIDSPPKLLMLAGNYAAHVREQGGRAAERDKTFPYVFMKPASTTLTGDSAEFHLPPNASNKLDHEVELAIVIGRTARQVSASQALNYVAGYTLINDISDRGFQPNPDRETRPKDGFFDWLHGKWHDGSCPCGPCLVTTDEIPDPQNLQLQLHIDGDLRQDGNTGQQTFSCCEVIEFLSSWMTLEPGDIISTGTPAGVGNASGKYLAAGQKVTCTNPEIGTLTTHISAPR